MTTEEQQKITEYLDSIHGPAETAFLLPAQMEAINKERSKYESSQLFVGNVVNKDGFQDTINRAVIDGKIYSASQMAMMSAKFSALEGDGTRVNITETLVSRSGQRVIMSNRLQQTLGFIGDGYMDKDELDELVSAMQADSVPGPEIDRVTAAVNKFGAVTVQRGIFIALKSMLEEVVGHTLAIYNSGSPAASFAPQQPKVASTAPVSSEEMPMGFIEYLKNNDKEFDRAEHEVVNDPQFVDFFANLQKHYDYYKKLPAEQMAHEIILRPQLWSKMSPQTRVWVQNLVDRNRDGFQDKVRQVAATSGAAKLDELKRTLVK